MTMTKTWSTLVAVVAAALVVAFSFAVAPANAAQSPAGCTADNSVVNISSDLAIAVPGDVITFTVEAGNPASGNGCDITGRTITLTLPDGTQFNYGPSNYPNPTAIGFVGDETYVADAAHLDGGVWAATVDWNGTLKSVSDIPSSGGKGVSVFPVLPLEIVKTADGTYDREWNWTIEKTVDEDELLLAEGETYTVNYEVEVDADSTDLNHRVGGTITITNPDGNPDATIDDITDIVDELDSGAAMDVDCEAAGWPVVLGAGDSLYCTYSGDATGSELENTVTVETSGDVPGGEDTVDIDWADEPTTETDECVDVTDTVEGVLGTVCASDAPGTFNYSVTFGPETEPTVDVVTACDDNFEYPNTANFVTNDTGAQGSDDQSVHVAVDCVVGCTLTQGYWKTHNDSFKGGAPTDENWENIGASKELTGFFTTANSYPVVGPNNIAAPFTWFSVFNTAPKGNVYYNLAHQYMAAMLNSLNGADVPSDVQEALDDATAHFTAFGPDATAGKGKNANKALKAELTSLAGILGSYNEGSEGVPHCDEQNPI